MKGKPCSPCPPSLPSPPTSPLLLRAPALASPSPRSIPRQTHPQETEEHKLVDAKQCHLQQGHEQQLGWPSLAQYSTKRDKHRPRAEVSIDHAGRLGGRG